MYKNNTFLMQMFSLQKLVVYFQFEVKFQKSKKIEPIYRDPPPSPANIIDDLLFCTSRTAYTFFKERSKDDQMMSSYILKTSFDKACYAGFIFYFFVNYYLLYNSFY